MKKILTTATAGFILLASYQVQAQAINDAGAQELKNLLNEQMQYADEVYAGVPELQLKHEGETIVTPQGTYYSVTLPHYSLTIADPSNPTDMMNLDIGKVAMNVTPQGDDAWSMSIAMPMPMKGTNGDGETIFNINIGEQKAHALFIPSLQTSPKYHLSYQDIVVSDIPGVDMDVRLGELTTSMKLEKSAKNFWTGPASFIAKNLSVDVKDEAKSLNFNLESMKVDAAYREFDLAGATKFYKELGTMDPEALTEGDTEKLMNDVFTQLFESMDGMDTSFDIANLSVNWSDAPGQQGSFTLGKAGFGFSSDGLRGDNGTISITGHLNKIDAPNVPAEFAGFIPQKVDYKASVLNLPVKTLFGLGKAMMETAMQGGNPESGMQDAIQIMSQSGTKFVLEKHNMDSAEVGIRANGEMKVDFSAAMKVIAQFKLSIRNMDALLAKYAPQAATLPPPIQGALMPMMMLQQLGTQTQDPATGQSMRTFEYQLMDDGKMLLNGQDLFALMGGAMQQQQPPRR